MPSHPLYFDIYQIDIIVVYLQGDLDEEIYMTIPDQVSQFSLGKHYWQLCKTLYGLK